MALTEPVLLKRVRKMTDSTSVEEFIKYGGFDALKKAVAMDEQRSLWAEAGLAIRWEKNGGTCIAVRRHLSISSAMQMKVNREHLKIRCFWSRIR